MKKIIISIPIIILLTISIFAIDDIVKGQDLTVTFLASNGSKITNGECRLNIYNSSGAWNKLVDNVKMNEISNSGIYNWTIPSNWISQRYSGNANCNKTHLTRAGTELDFYVLTSPYETTLNQLSATISNITVNIGSVNVSINASTVASAVWNANLSQVSGRDKAGNLLYNMVSSIWSFPSRLMTGGNITEVGYIKFVEFIQFVENLG